MHELPAPFRPAAREDAPALAELVNLAGEGLPLHLWRSMARAGEDPWAVGRGRAQREEGSFSYRNAVVAEAVDGRIAACLIGYPLPDAPEKIDYDRTPAMFVPLQELENLAGGTWYVNVVATFPDYRNQGLGTRLLGLAEDIAGRLGKRGLSLIVADANAAARRLYARSGYREIAMRPIVGDGWQTEAENWVLMIKSLRADGS